MVGGFPTVAAFPSIKEPMPLLAASAVRVDSYWRKEFCFVPNATHRTPWWVGQYLALLPEGTNGRVVAPAKVRRRSIPQLAGQVEMEEIWAGTYFVCRATKAPQRADRA